MTDAEPLPRILIVDDEPINVKVLVDLLRPSYGLIVARDGREALERLKGEALPDLALVDVMMPNMDGLNFCRFLKSDARLAEMPVIFVTALGRALNEAEGFEAGAVDYITKPISPSIVLARVRTQISLQRARRELMRRNEALEEAVRERTLDLALTQEVTIQALSSLVESRDLETGGHILRTQHYLRTLALEMRADPRFANGLNDRIIEMMCKSAPLHDIGKVGIPDSILRRPGPLSSAEFEVMKTHTSIGRRALTDAAGNTSRSSEFLRLAIEIVSSHHEKWDGSGYPEGLKGEDIPLSARLMALADVYDALRSRRVYKQPISREQSRSIILAGRGKHFDPVIVDAFTRCEPAFAEIADIHSDETRAVSPAA